MNGAYGFSQRLTLASVLSLVGLFTSLLGSDARAAVAGSTQPSASRSYPRIQAELKAINTRYPQSTELFSIGMSGTGHTIDGIRVGHGAVNNLIVATHHGNEYGATEVALASAEDLAKNPIAAQSIWVIPVLNISGFEHDRREESLDGNRRRGETADANRDYPGPCGTEGPFRLKSTKALAEFIDSHAIVAAATLHTFYPVVAYPWGFGTPDLSTPYDQIFIDLATVAVEVSGYPVGNSTAAIYPASGTFEDYSFWKHGIWALLFELGHTHSPNPDELAELDRLNVPGLRKMMEHAPLVRAADHGFHGRCDGRLKALDRHDE